MVLLSFFYVQMTFKVIHLVELLTISIKKKKGV